LNQFAYAASHDLQEPLRTISTQTQLLAKKYKGKLDAQADSLIDFVVEAANRMQVLSMISWLYRKFRALTICRQNR
jgi:light-regulated signal transduction histidine kinase (bacteriophytochrome)